MKIKLYTTLLTLAVISTFTQAATITWTGLAGDGNFESAGNWTGDRTPPAVDDFQDIATFTSATTPSTITLGSGRDIGGLRFETAGWTLDGGLGLFKEIYSTGTGTNTITGNLNEARGNRTWSVVGADHTLRVVGEIRYYSQDITLTGGGTLWTDRLDAAGFSTPTFTLNGATLKLEDDRPHETASDNGVIRINTDGFLQMKTSNVGSITSLFGSEIVDLTGNGLQAVYDRACPNRG